MGNQSSSGIERDSYTSTPGPDGQVETGRQQSRQQQQQQMSEGWQSPFENSDLFDFEGEESKDTMISRVVGCLVRSESVDVTNDPRIMSDNVISHRLGGFSNVVIASMLLCTLAFSAILVDTPRDEMEEVSRAVTFISLAGMLVTMCLNLFCTVVVIQQMYVVNRISTSGSMGFEMAKSLYLNRTYVTLRHFAITAFFKSIPIFVMSTAALVWVTSEKNGGSTVSRAILCVPMRIVTALMFYVHKKQKVIFQEKLMKMQTYEQPMLHHMTYQLPGPHVRRGEVNYVGLD
jgi:hypothetical protein